MRRLIHILLVPLANFVTVFLNAQEKWGVGNSNYISTGSIFLNPSSSVDSKTYMQLNLIGANVYAMNNIAYLKNFWIYDLKKNSAYTPTVDLNLQKLPKFIYANASADGPAFVISKRNYGAGLFVRARGAADARVGSLATSASYAVQEGTNSSDIYLNLKNTRASAMSWVEYGGNFGLMLKRDRNTLISGGVNLRYITGINIMYGRFSELNGYYNNTLIHIQNMEAVYKYNEAAFNSGRGAATDIGFTYKKMTEPVNNYYANSTRCNCRKIDYIYKVGFTLRDLGYIRFNRNTYTGTSSGSGDFYTDRNDTSYISAIQSFTDVAQTAQPFFASLPTSAVTQLDYNFLNGFYVNVTAIKNLVPNSVTGVRANDVLAVSPRFEVQNFEFTLPLTFQKFIYPQLGLAMRYRGFALGVDNVLPFVISKNTYGAGVYFSWTLSLFKNPDCNKKSQRVDLCPAKKK